MGDVLELGRAVDPAAYPDIARRPGICGGERRGDGRRRRRGEETPDSKPRPERKEDETPGGERDEAGDDQRLGIHGRDDSGALASDLELDPGPEVSARRACGRAWRRRAGTTRPVHETDMERPEGTYSTRGR